MMFNKIIGPQVAIIDDIKDEIISIETVLDEMNIGSKFFEVDYTQPKYPSEPINTIELVFLDLFYNPNIGAEFDPYACAQWLKHIIPSGKKYILIAWTKDTHVMGDLVKIIHETGATIPYYFDTKLKREYQTGQYQYNIKLLLDELDSKLQKKIETSIEEFYGQIISIEEISILINCRIYEDPVTFEVRRFDKNVLNNYIDLTKGNYIKIKITTSPGHRVFEFSNEESDLSSIFIKPDDFEDIGDISFLKGL